MSALRGDCITARSDAMPWYVGLPLMEHLETVEVARGAERPFRLPVQWVNRPNLDFRGFSGRIAGGTVRPGDAVRALPSGKTSTVTRIVTMGGDLEAAHAGDSITLTLADEIDVSRGDVLVPADDPPETANQFDATLVWMADEPMLPGRSYLMKIGAQTVAASVTALKYAIDVNTLAHEVATQMELNAIARCNLSVDRRIPFDPFEVSPETGGFILIDRLTNATVGMGMINFALRRSTNVHWQDMTVGREGRVAVKPHRPAVLWFTGLSGSGKSTIANILEAKLNDPGRAHGAARRRQRAPRAEPRSGLHGRRPGGEHPPGGRGEPADGGCGPRHARLLHLPFPRGTAHGARAQPRGRVHRGARRHPRWRWPRAAT